MREAHSEHKRHHNAPDQLESYDAWQVEDPFLEYNSQSPAPEVEQLPRRVPDLRRQHAHGAEKMAPKAGTLISCQDRLEKLSTIGAKVIDARGVIAPLDE